ncbi:hypothetical protein CLV29_0233 [Naumannella halotolerans]|uniref:ApeA N-terminal domain-containing protein n=2 Tax=Naumannella halotolerans TaxID=993414 RepID=A0A4R7J8G2_9ACTN|nr:hypothetical protein CLV29_0233 [Naumannella halotolerans]
MSYGDDPDYRLHDYSMPTQAWFYDPHGVICLVEPHGRSHSFGTLQEGRLRFAYAIEVGDVGLRYERINAMQSRIEGLEEWIPISSIEHEYVHEDDSILSSIFTVKRQAPVKISRVLNAQIRPAYSFMASSVPGQTTLADEMRVKTSATRARSWQEHLDVHRGVRDLLVVAGWRDYGTWDLSVSRQDDPERALAGNALGDRWARVSTYAMPKPTGNDQGNRFLFKFDDVGAPGIGRWLRLRRRHRRAISGMIHSVGMPGVALETASRKRAQRLNTLATALRSNEAKLPAGTSQPICDASQSNAVATWESMRTLGRRASPTRTTLSSTPTGQTSGTLLTFTTFFENLGCCFALGSPSAWEPGL